MDPAQQIELDVLRHQEPMNSVIDRGDSPVQQFFEGATVFVTGGSGFIGKQLIEKLFRSCAIKKLYLLARAKKGKTVSERLQIMLKDPVYDMLRQKQPNFSDLIVPVEGDVADIRLGLSDGDRKMITNEVNIVFHVAATVRFDEPLRVATLTNVRGTREVLSLFKECVNLKKFVHVSTAFTHATKDRVNTDVAEEFYPSPVPPELMIQMAETVDEKRLDAITPNLIDGWPNTYTFTKALAEEYLRRSAGDLPVCIVRPSIVLPAYYEPGPGWLDLSTVIGPSGVYLASGLGVMHVFKTDVNFFMPMAPVDYVNNAIIASAWDSTNSPNDTKQEIPIYTIRRPMRFGLASEIISKEAHRLNTPYAVWKIGVYQIKNKILYYVLALLLHYIPAIVLDMLCTITGKKLKQIPSLLQVYLKIEKLSLVYDYFMMNRWNFKDDNLQGMVKRMNASDKAIFNCDVSTIDIHEYIMIWGVGLRKYIIKDGLKNTLKANRRQQLFTVANYFVLALYGYALWYIFCVVYIVFKNIILLFY